MARNGSGKYNLPAGNPVVTGTLIEAAWANPTMADIGLEITNSLPRDGQAPPTANLPMGGFKLTGMGVGNVSTDSCTFGQLSNAISGKAIGYFQERQTATAGQTLFTLTSMDYTVGSNQLAIFADGLRLTGGGVDFTETSATSVTFTAAFEGDEEIVFVVGKENGSTGWIGVSADTTGATDAFSAFQAAINLTPDVAGIQIFHVPRGTYAGALSGLSASNRTLVWVEEGGVSYTTSPPPGTRINSRPTFTFAAPGSPPVPTLSTNNGTRDWHVGLTGFANENGTSTGLLGEQPIVRIVRTADHAGGDVASQVSSAITIEENIGAGVRNYESTLNLMMRHSSDGSAVAAEVPNFVAAQITGERLTLGSQTARTYALNLVAQDWSGRKSSVSKGAVTGCEIDIRASGQDDNATRHGLAIIPAGRLAPSGGDTQAEIDAALRIVPSSNASLFPVTINHGVKLEDSGVGGYAIGYFADAPFATAVIDARNRGAAGKFRFGSDQQVAGDITVDFELWGKQTNGLQVQYGEILSQITDPADGAYTGTMRIRTANTAVMTDQIGFRDGVIVGAPTGSYKGVGSINVAADIYKNNTAYTNPDYVFEFAYTGKIDQFAGRDGASDYVGLMPLDALREHTRRELRLPGITDEPLGMFARSDKVLEKLEELTLYILDLHDRIKALEPKA